LCGRMISAPHARRTLPTGASAKQYFTGLGTIISEIDGLAASETSGFGAERQGTTTRAQARDALLEDLEALSRTARDVERDAGDRKQVSHSARQ